MSDDHPHRRCYDNSHWPMKSDGNGHYLLGRNTTYVSLALAVMLIAGAITATRDVTELRGKLANVVEQTERRSKQIKGLREDQRNFEKFMSDSLGRIHTQITLLEYKIKKMESSSNARAEMHNAHRR